MLGRVLLSVIVALLFAATVMFIRAERDKREFDQRMAECVKYAKANVPEVDPWAWCQP